MRPKPQRNGTPISSEFRKGARDTGTFRDTRFTTLSQFYLIGQTIVAEFNYRSDSTKRIDREWFEGYIWRYAPQELLRQSHEGTRVLFPRDALAWYQALPNKSAEVLSFSIFARVEDNGSGGTFLRLLGAQIRPDKDGIREIVW